MCNINISYIACNTDPTQENCKHHTIVSQCPPIHMYDKFL